MRFPVLVGRHAGKCVFTGHLNASEVVRALRNGEIVVNELAQRSLAPRGGKHKVTTQQLLEDEQVHKTPRMKELVKFLERVMDKVEKADVGEGFLGAPLLLGPQPIPAVPGERTGCPYFQETTA